MLGSLIDSSQNSLDGGRRRRGGEKSMEAGYRMRRSRMGMMMGAQLGNQAGQMATHLPPAGAGGPPPAPSAPAVQFHVVVNAQQLGPFPLAMLQQMIPAGTFTAASLVWRQGMAGWQVASIVPELADLFGSTAQSPTPSMPPLPPVQQ